MRRGINDEKWKELKERILIRDEGQCRFLKILSYKEALLLYQQSLDRDERHLVSLIDPAHIFPVSVYPHLIYEDLNVILMNRFAHSYLEDRICPLTGNRLTEDEYKAYFIRILGEEAFDKLKKWAYAPEEYKKEKETKNE